MRVVVGLPPTEALVFSAVLSLFCHSFFTSAAFQAPDVLMRVEIFAMLSCANFEPISRERNHTETMHGASSPLAPTST